MAVKTTTVSLTSGLLLSIYPQFRTDDDDQLLLVTIYHVCQIYTQLPAKPVLLIQLSASVHLISSSR